MAHIKAYQIQAGKTIGHGSMLYPVVAVKDYDTEIAIWYSSPTGVKRRAFYPEDNVYQYDSADELMNARANLLHNPKYTNVSEAI